MRSGISPTRNRLQQCSLAVLALVLILFVGWNYWLPTVEDFLNRETRAGSPPNVDFFVYYTAGNRFHRGDNPYFWDETDPSLEDFSDYIYPPTLLPFYRWLSGFNYRTARYIWFGISMALYGISFGILCWLTRPRNRFQVLILGIIITMVSFPLLFHIRNGQSDVLVFSVVLIGWMAYAKGWRILAAFFLAIATLLKVSPLFFLIYFVLYARDLRFLLAYSISLLVIILLSLIAVPFELYPDYMFHVLPNISSGTPYWHNQSLLKFFATNEGLAKSITAIGFGFFAGLAWMLGGRKTPAARLPRIPYGEGNFKAEAFFIWNMLTILLLVGKAWSTTYVWTIHLSTLFLIVVWDKEPAKWYIYCVGIAVFLLNSKIYGYPILDSLNLFGNVLMSICLAIWILKEPWVFPMAHSGSTF